MDSLVDIESNFVIQYENKKVNNDCTHTTKSAALGRRAGESNNEQHEGVNYL